MKHILLIVLMPLIVGCSTIDNEKAVQRESNEIAMLIDEGCKNLPNLLEKDNRPVIEVWKKSKEAFGQLARIDTQYLQVARAVESVSEWIEPFKDGKEDINLINAFCAGIGSVTQ